MALRFETNYIRFTGAAPFPIKDSDPIQRWIRVHEWNVDVGYTATLLGLMLNVEPQFPVPTTLNYGWMRVKAMLDTSAPKWETKFECNFQGAAMTNKQFTPRLVIIPCGNGIVFTAGQGLLSQALPGVATVFRWWSAFVINTG